MALFSHVPFEHMTARDVLARLGLLCGNGTLTNAAVQADIFWDHADVYSPGGFPAGVSPEAYLSGEADASRPRNPLIVRALYRSGDIEAYGTGLRRIKAACDAQGTPVEVFGRAGSVHVSFTRQEALDSPRRLGPFAPADSLPESSDNGRQAADKSSTANRGDLSATEKRILELVGSAGHVSTTQVSEALGIPARTVRRALARLADKGFVTPAGANKNRTYSLRSDGPAASRED